MIRDIESLIEYLYLRVANPGLLWEKIIVNPIDTDNCNGHTVIINKLYDLPIVTGADQIISRIPELGFNVIPYDVSIDNKFISKLPLVSDRLEVFKDEDVFYFSDIPNHLISDENCYWYLNSKLSQSPNIKGMIETSF